MALVLVVDWMSHSGELAHSPLTPHVGLSTCGVDILQVSSHYEVKKIVILFLNSLIVTILKQFSWICAFIMQDVVFLL